MSRLHSFGDADGLFNRARAVFGVGARSVPRDAVAGFKAVHVAGADGDDGAFCFTAEDFRLWGGIEAGAVVAECEVLGALFEEDGGKGVYVRVDIIYAYVVVFN